MSPQCIGYIIGIILLTALSAFFSASETAYNSLNKIKLKNKANEGSRGAKKALLLSFIFFNKPLCNQVLKNSWQQ